MTKESSKKTISDFMSMTKENHPEIHEEFAKTNVLPVFQAAATSLIELYKTTVSNGTGQPEVAKSTIRTFGNTCRNNPPAISGIELFNNFAYNLNLSKDKNKNELIKSFHSSIKDEIEVYEQDEADEPSSNGSGKIVQSYICVYVGQMRLGMGADIQVIDSVGDYFNWFLGPYDLKAKDIKIDGAKLTADLQVDDENGLDVELDFNDPSSLVKLEEDIDVIMFSEGSPWRTEFYPVYEGEPLKAGEIFSDSL